MINVHFTECLGGILKMANYYAKLDNSEIQDLTENLFHLILDLDFGDISELEFGEKRKKDYIEMFGCYDTEIRTKWFNDHVKRISQIKVLLEQGHEIRIWYSENSREFCAFCWLLSVLESWGIQNDQILYVRLPQNILFNSGEYETYGFSGMFEPELIAQLVSGQRYLTESYKNHHIRQWRQAQEENAEMRIILYGHIVGVKADFFDSIILSIIEKMDDIFSEVHVVGESLVRIGTMDAFPAWRIDKMVENGRFEVVEETEEAPSYRRMLKKL